jgi:DNA-binding XRE family transcriptional regulator
MNRKRPQDAEWSTYAKELGFNIAHKRIELGLSQEQVAYAADLSRYTYQKLENGVGSKPTGDSSNPPSNPSLRNVMAVAQVLGVAIEEILPEWLPDLSAR